ncbi:Hypothetical protein, putative [Bodo saltans]|uniref:Uncharacterized protein n=1 Tax=Bodo saltans TaxID=75058 RepID=A0A0S4J9I7_BODSA|nr:Hypothetical protein, putative [Bodo saltans]|eukprot:CUG86793.1 Hypothetical protein, putative [Bodo saltans]
MSLTTRLRVTSQPLIFRRRGRFTAASAVSVQPQKINESRLIDAEIIHGGDEQAFWTEKRWFSGAPGTFMPTWDRSAQTLILLSRAAPRVPQEAAFRLFSVFMKMLMITKVTELASTMLPLWATVNMEGLIQQAKKEVAESSSDAAATTEEKVASVAETPAAASPPEPPVA